MKQEKAFIVIAFDINQAFFGFFNSLDNSTKELPVNGLYILIFTYSPFIDLIIQPDPSLI